MSDSKLINYLPPILQDVKEMQVIMDMEDQQFDQLQGGINRFLDDQFVMSASLEAIRQRELELGIQANPSQESVDFRRKRIINRYSTKAPFTERYLQQQLDKLVGPGVALVSVDTREFFLYVTAKIEEAAVFKEVVHTVQKVKPANMVYQQQTALTDSITLEEKISKAELSRMTGLSTTWQLGITPFAVRGEEVRIK